MYSHFTPQEGEHVPPWNCVFVSMDHHSDYLGLSSLGREMSGIPEDS